MKDKLCIKIHRSNVITSNLVRLPNDAIQIVRSLQRESGLSASSIVAQIIRWAQDRNTRGGLNGNSSLDPR